MPKKNGLARNEVRIRMYRVGFGDCFLLSFPAKPGFAHVLIDCGVHARGDIGTIPDVVADIAAETESKLAVVIATHRHRDHISGFATGLETFRTFTVGQTWMPWTENPADKTAAKLRKKQSALVDRLTAHFNAAGGSEEVLAAVANFSLNKTAMDLLQSAFGTGEACYFAAGDKLATVKDVPGLSVRFLGPPRDQESLARMDPPQGDRYLRATADGTEEVNHIDPFPSRWVIPPEDKRIAHLRLLEREQTDVRDALRSSSLEDLAFALDDAINNTSLVTLFSFRGLNLLLAGDAQYGNWQAWLDSDEAADILGGIHFYKVAHHGSENATPRRAVEGMANGQCAVMVPTQVKPFASIPRKPLMQALEEKSDHQVIRSDSIVVAQAPKGPELDKLPARFTQGKLWFDWTHKVGVARRLSFAKITSA
jgi:beta-lactamase superfamily II metal-dependent hydrolase